MGSLPLTDRLSDEAEGALLEPDFQLIEFIHRDPRAWIAFCTKHEGKFRGLLSCQLGDLAGMFPEMRAELARDSYFALNGMFRPGAYQSNRAPEYRGAYRAADGVRRLTVCYADLDYYKLELSFGQAVGAILDAQDNGVIPPASVLVRSGRGVWPLWLLYDADEPSLPVRAWPERVATWAELQRTIGQRLEHIGSDAQARDVARVARIPGSEHTGVGRRVQYVIQADDDGNGYQYTLEELCEFFGIVPAKRRTRVTRTERTENAFTQRAQKGQRELRQKRIRQIEKLCTLRGGIRQGQRNSAAMLYAYFLATAHLPEEEVTGRLAAFGSSCIPPLRPGELRDARRGGRTTLRGIRSLERGDIKNDTIAEWLDITPEEAMQLEGWPCAPRFRRHLAAVPDHAPTKVELRRAFIREFVNFKCGGVAPSLREMVTILKDEGFDASRGTVATDYKALGIRSGYGSSDQESLFAAG